jgi:hypothetical protein
VILTPTCYFPDLLLLSLISLSDNTRLEAHEHYQKGDFRNRCYIRSKNGLQTLTVPLEKNSRHQCPIKEVRISYHEPWHKKHWQAIQTAYGNAPYFAYFAPELKQLYDEPGYDLWKFNRQSLDFILPVLIPGIDLEETTIFEKSTDFQLKDRRSYTEKNKVYTLADEWIRDYQNLPGFTSCFTLKLSALDALFFLGPAAQSFLRHSGKIIEDNLNTGGLSFK